MKFLVLNNNAVVVLQYTSDHVSELHVVRFCAEESKVELEHVCAFQNKVVTQMVSVPFPAAKT